MLNIQFSVTKMGVDGSQQLIALDSRDCSQKEWQPYLKNVKQGPNSSVTGWRAPRIGQQNDEDKVSIAFYAYLKSIAFKKKKSMHFMLI